jgi:pyruvate dehydrogenase E1 component beta subunit
LYRLEGPFDLDAKPAPMHAAAVKRSGTDITLIAWSRMIQVTLQAADTLAARGIDAEVIDLRSLQPINFTLLQTSVGKSHRCAVIAEDCLYGGAAAEISVVLAERFFYELDAPVMRIAAADVPTPYNGQLEAASTPDAANVASAVMTMYATRTGRTE